MSSGARISVQWWWEPSKLERSFALRSVPPLGSGGRSVVSVGRGVIF